LEQAVAAGAVGGRCFIGDGVPEKGVPAADGDVPAHDVALDFDCIVGDAGGVGGGHDNGVCVCLVVPGGFVFDVSFCGADPGEGGSFGRYELFGFVIIAFEAAWWEGGETSRYKSRLESFDSRSG